MESEKKRIIVPPIKCQGIKTKLVRWVQSLVPDNVRGRWVEPFLGSGVVAFNAGVQRAVLCDSNPHIIRFYRAVQTGEITAQKVRDFLVVEGEKLLKSDGEHYYAVRERFNLNGSALDFLFLNRACFNGLIRFNQKGNFNTPFCRKPARFAKAYITKICNQIDGISKVILDGDYVFKCQHFSITLRNTKKSDIVYCDPPYIARNNMFFNDWNVADEKALCSVLQALKSKFILSTWHHNKHRKNPYIDSLWGEYNVLLREHFYFLGGREKNRGSMVEAIVTNFSV